MKRAGDSPSEPPGSVPSPDRERLVTERQQPVALLVAEVDGDVAPVITAITDHGGFLAWQRGRRCVGVFTGGDVSDPAGAALAAARELVDRHGARAALHVASVMLRSGAAGSPAAHGEPVEDPETWTPSEPWSGLVLTAAFERAVPEAEVAPRSGVSSARGWEIDEPVLGREGEIEALAASVAAAFDGTCPLLCTLIGDSGLGKTRLVIEAARVAASAWPDATIVSLQAHLIHGGAAQTTRALLAFAMAAPRDAPPDPRAFCEKRLGEALGAAVWPAVADALGWAEAPGGAWGPAALRHGVLQALAEGLRRRARRGPVAVILDDAHQADDVVLDALEYATLDGVGVRLWVVVACGPRFEQVRRGWGSRNQRHTKVTLSPLGERPMMDFAAYLLSPAEYPPADTLRRLAEWAGGNPACLREIVRSLKKAGIVHLRPGGAHYVATAEIDAIPPSPAWQWLAMRQLDELLPELAACIRICAVLGVSFRRDELEVVLQGIDAAGGESAPIDAEPALAELVERGVLQRDADQRYAFQNTVLQSAIHELLDPAHREQIHHHALLFWRARAEAADNTPEALGSRARHAAACGERAEAAGAHIELGDLASAKHRHVDADQRYTAALGVAAEDDLPRRARALAGRGRSRYRAGYLVREARADFAAALELAAILGDRRLEARLLLEDATVLDWARRFDESAARVEEARRLLEGPDLLDFEAPLLVADGRTAWRQGQLESSMELLKRGIAGAVAVGDYDSEVIGLLMLSFELAHVGSLVEAEARFNEVIARVTKAGDLFHLCTAYANRVVFGMGSLPGAVDDMRRAVDLAREIGNPFLEHLVSYNVAALLYWKDRLRDALVLALRARLLEERFMERPEHYTPLLLAEILALLGDYDEASRWVAGIEQAGLPEPHERPSFYTLQLVLAEVGITQRSPSAPAWDDVVQLQADNHSTEGMLMVLYWRARMALRGERREEAAAALSAALACRENCAMWVSRFDALDRDMR